MWPWATQRLPSARWCSDMSTALRIAALLTVLCVGACATPPDIPPLLDISAAQCTQQPDLANAIVTVATVDGDSEKPRTATLNLRSGCIDGADGRSLYAVFAMPDGGPFTISVSSLPQGRSVLAPRARILDAQGVEVRRLPPSSFLFRGPNLTALYRSHPGEHYLVVSSDPPSVGKPLRRLQENVQATTAGAGGIFVTIYTGTDIASEATWSHNGEISVSVVSDKPAKK